MVHQGTDSSGRSKRGTLIGDNEISDNSEKASSVSRSRGGLSDSSGRSNVCPSIVAVYNGRVLNISPELICHALSGISFKHYDGSCSQPDGTTMSKESLLGEGYIFDHGETIFAEEKEFSGEISQTSSELRLCYVPGGHDTDGAPENALEGESYIECKPLCVLDKIRDRNSFWNLHRPELCKLTWPHAYVGEATVTEHLHRHLLRHGEICAEFHEHRDMLALLDKELDSYDKLKELQPPRELPPDEKPFHASGKRKPVKTRPYPRCVCTSTETVNWKDESDLDLCHFVHKSKEEFCITIGKPVRATSLPGSPAQEHELVQLPCEEEVYEYGEYQDFSYSEFGEDGSFTIGEVETEDSCEEDISVPESVLQKPIGWVEPDFCAML